ncbi:hypothetical protein DVR12_19350 [Chitinophaga silvatica]|uniref:Beta-lactamase-inhibitor-like PepSY-like domain-containing protein n=1 Tax=Chitinophaga silvatica TaxID=2282649 RepID=A0A3E1Y6Y6_9BACT|nr:hypothetical protein [Chitinophaga silvatica]RFS20716.1 hypothetical protein DVR12_19350 [Chitinophaga silvatica]
MKKLMISMALILAVLATNAQTDPPMANSKMKSKEGKMKSKEVRKDRREQRRYLRELNGTDVSEQSKLQFISDFGDKPDVVWSHDVYFDKATFTNSKGTRTSAFYDYDGQLVGTSTPVSFNDLPANAKDYIMRHYSNYEDAPVIFYDDNELNEDDMIMYGVQFESSDNYFIEVTDKKNKRVVLQVSPEGEVTYFTDVNNNTIR